MADVPKIEIQARSVGVELAVIVWIFFFSSRRRHTRCSRDWSSDVCSSDLYRLETLFHQARYCERWRRNRSGSRLHVALDVFSQDVAFEVNRVAGLSVADVGVVIGIRNDGHFRDAMMPLSDGEADAVNRDRSLQNDVARQLIGHFDAVPPVLAFSSQMRHVADGVYMS